MSKRQRNLKWNKTSYRELVNLKLPIKRKRAIKEKLYPVQIIERQPGRVKVHYIGYNNSYDEWKDENELEELDSNSVGIDVSHEITADNQESQTYSLYKDLSLRIKRALSCSRTASPVVRITMPFDVTLFNGGLRLAAVPLKKSRGCQQYKIKHYQDLNHLLGMDWHIRVINRNGDYGYAVSDTVKFHIRKNRPIVEYVSSANNGLTAHSIDAGYSLVFTFVCKYGSSCTLDKDRAVFCNK